jgi:hypothetical protein
MPTNPIQTDPVILKLLDKVPANMRSSFSDEQLLALKIAVGGRTWGTHVVDLRWTLKWWRWHYYFVFLTGRNRRNLSARERKIELASGALVLAVFLSISTVFGIFVLYILKSALGIDLIPSFSFGVWGWFQETYLQ